MWFRGQASTAYHQYQGASGSKAASKAVAPTSVAAAAAADEDLLDISDTELIRASQVVESQLKFTNNVHHTTNNAMNIFSQFSQASCTNSQYHGGVDFNTNQHHNQQTAASSNYHQPGGRGMMGPPSNYPPSSYSATAAAASATFISCTNPNYADMSDEEVRGEMARLKSENMQKDGEVIWICTNHYQKKNN